MSAGVLSRLVRSHYTQMQKYEGTLGQFRIWPLFISVSGSDIDMGYLYKSQNHAETTFVKALYLFGKLWKRKALEHL